LPQGRADEKHLVADMIELARQYGRYGYRRVAALLRDAGWQVNDKRVERLWKREGLKVPMKQPKKGRLWLNDGSCVRLRPEYRNHVWSYDFVHHRTDDGRAFRTLNILDEHSRECLAIRVKRKLNSTEVIDALTDLFILRGIPAYIRSDNGPEFIAEAVRGWITAVGAKTAFIEPGSPWENGYCESFNGRMRDELLNGEIFYSLREARECHELCVSGPAHAGFRYGHALNRSSNIIANWLRAANHSRTLRPPFSKLRIAR
jgi:transposase InsO family protein